MHVLVTGGTGFIGTALVDDLVEGAHRVTVLTRKPRAGKNRLDYVSSLDVIRETDQIDAVINLAGASLAERRWTRKYKNEIYASRLTTTRSLLEMMKRLQRPPSVLLNASAIGFYGHHGDERLDEDGMPVPGFAQELCAQWEELASQAVELGVRVCLLRLGVVLDAGGGAFSQMDRPFRMGVANWLGDGKQWLSWIHRADVIAAIRFLLQDESLSGPFNFTAPNPVTSRGFCDAMKRHRHTFLSAPVPAPVMRLLVGEMADELLLNGQRVIPRALEEAGFVFQYPLLEDALTAIG